MTYYIKATLDNGWSESGNPKIQYKIGLNVCSDADKDNTSACGKGIHLAKSLEAARSYVHQATEFYLAKSGIILGEDDSKVRCTHRFIIKKLTAQHIKLLTKYEDVVNANLQREKEKERERQEHDNKLSAFIGGLSPNNLLVSKEWLEQHALDVTQAMIDAQGLELFTDNKRACLIKAKLDKKSAKEVIKSHV